MERKKPSTLPRALELELRRAARPGHADEAVRLMERSVRARERGKTNDARRDLERVKREAPRSVSVRAALGKAAFEAGEWHSAAQEFLTYKRLTGERTHDPMIAECYRRRGKPDRALEVLEGLDGATVPSSVRIAGVIARARALSDAGRIDAARAMLETALRGATSGSRTQLRAVLSELIG